MTVAENTTDLKLGEVISRVRENEGKLHIFQSVELGLIGAYNFPDLFRHLLVEFRNAFSHDIVKLVLADPEHEIRRLMEEYADEIVRREDVHLLTERRDCGGLARLGFSPMLRAYQEHRDGWMFPGVSPTPESVAYLPLARSGSVIGVLALGSYDVGRFTADVATDFLEHLAAVAGVCIENKLNLHRLRSAGLTDPLTGARNRRFLEERLTEEIARARRNQQPLSFLFLDIDYFKRVNDRYGHQSGDCILHGVAQRIACTLRVNDILTRYGGEEFAALLPDTDMAEAAHVAERVRRSVCEQPFALLDREEASIAVSIGVSALNGEPRGASFAELGERLMEAADRALYRSKEGGRNRVTCAQR